MDSEEEEDTTVCSVLEKPLKPPLSPAPGSPRKRMRSSENLGDSPRRELLTLPLRRPTGGCSVPRQEQSPLHCPMCPHTEVEADKMQLHVNRSHLDSLSPAPGQHHACPLCPTTFSNPTLLQSHFSSKHPDLSPEVAASPVCPVCGERGWSSQQLQLHVESHFGSASCSSADQESERLAAELDVRERAKRRREEEAEFASLQQKYGMDEQGNFTEQSAAGLRKAVVSGDLSVVDYYERSAGLAESQRSGVDDGSSLTPKITSILRGLSMASPSVVETLLASRTDHYASTFGDKGWGCGFRNLQMVVSCLLHSTQYRETVVAAVEGNRNLGGRLGAGVPSLPRLQRVIEEAWRAGFDRAGCEQLGGRLVNSRKWIGATEIATFLSFCNVDSEIYDFHAPR